LGAYLPVALNLEGRQCLVVGGGEVAERKVEALLDASANVVVVASSLSARIEALGLFHAIEIRPRAYVTEDLDGVFLVVAATDDREANARVAAEARERGALVNAVDDPSSCDFITPAVVRRGDIQVAITTGGVSPALARHLRELLDRLLAPEYEELAALLAEARAELRRDDVRADPQTWQAAIRAALLPLRSGDTEGARAELNRVLRTGPRPLTPDPARTGRIVLVGAGPGDPALLTLAGRDAIAAADVIVYDRLVNPALLDFARHARLVYVGKRRGGGPRSQTEINELLCAEAHAGNLVVRLKGGDPFVFGRGGEEALAAREGGIPFSVVPGVSAAVAVPAYAGIPVTHRGLSSAFTVVTAHEDPSKPDGAVDWDALARVGGTLVLLMGAETLPDVCARLVAGGRAADTPAAVIHCGTMDDQRVVTGDLSNIADRARAADIRAPATTVVGEVAALAEALGWHEGPLHIVAGGKNGVHG
jgi:uroporphyrin-III C-methyltransferase/precorrin-2 dehydrogenase/sirohydrochlorin ferrochelatase